MPTDISVQHRGLWRLQGDVTRCQVGFWAGLYQEYQDFTHGLHARLRLSSALAILRKRDSTQGWGWAGAGRSQAGLPGLLRALAEHGGERSSDRWGLRCLRNILPET